MFCWLDQINAESRSRSPCALCGVGEHQPRRGGEDGAEHGDLQDANVVKVPRVVTSEAARVHRVSQSPRRVPKLRGMCGGSASLVGQQILNVEGQRFDGQKESYL